MDSPDPLILVTPWSKTPTKAYESVDVELVALVEVQQAMLLLTKPNGFSMAMVITAPAIEQLYKDLTEIRRRFKAEKKGETL